jgi:hypothetical protein
VRYANAAGRVGRFDIRHLLNGLVDSYLYHSGRVDTTVPFDELRRNASDLPGISVRHTDELAGRVHELRQVDNLVFTLYTIIHRPKGLETRARFSFTVPNFPCSVGAGTE